jgi:ABC-type amino acid transport substrate-binding protein
MEKISVINPIGAEAVEQKNLAKRLDTLNGKVVAEVWNEDFKGDIMFPIYRELLKERFPDVKIIPYTDIPYASLKGTPSYQREVLGDIINALREKGADAVITGNGG